MLNILDDTPINMDILKKEAGGIGRVITDDYQFMETKIGIDISEVCNEIYRLNL
jgi:hypothetical protein